MILKFIMLVDEIDLIPSSGFSLESFFRGFLGIFSVLFLAYIFSNKKSKIAWKTIFLALISQLIIGFLILKVPLIQLIFEKAGSIFVKLIDFTREGTIFVFGDLLKPKSTSYIWAFEILPTVIFFSAITSILFYFGIIQKVVSFFAKVYTKFLKISGSESLSVIGNIFLGQTEAPLLIKAYLPKMNKSEILLVMIGGMATVAGGVLAAYIAFLGGDDPVKQVEFAKHLLTASVMAAPGAILISKIIIPQTEEISSDVNISDYDSGSNILDAISNGTIEGIKLAVNIGAMVIVFIALIAMVNYMLFFVGDISGLNSIIESKTIYNELSLEAVMGIIFSPLMWLIGVSSADIVPMGQLLGIKLSVNEFIAYMQLADFKVAGAEVILKYEKSLIMATYMLCGFANFSSIGIQIGGIGALAPNQRKNLAKFGLKALVGGALASLLSAAIAGMLIG